jgi:hypothetical protein
LAIRTVDKAISTVNKAIRAVDKAIRTVDKAIRLTLSATTITKTTLVMKNIRRQDNEISYLELRAEGSFKTAVVQVPMESPHAQM